MISKTRFSRRIKSYVQAQHWFQDLTTVGV
jgi:hypothetical protein